jgi:hypothetical protein
MSLRSALPLLVAGAASIGCARQAAAQSRVIDEGTFVVLRGGSPVRTESFKIARNVDGGMTATAQLSAGTQHTTSLLATDTSGTPLLYELRVKDRGAKVIELRAVARSGRLSSMASSATGDESMREFPLTSGRSVIVDGGLMHHLYFAALGKPAGSMQIIEPRAMRSMNGTLSARGLDPLTVAGKSVTATRYSLVAGAVRYEFWVDAQGRLLRVDGPDGLSATREELPR